MSNLIIIVSFIAGQYILIAHRVIYLTNNLNYLSLFYKSSLFNGSYCMPFYIIF